MYPKEYDFTLVMGIVRKKMTRPDGKTDDKRKMIKDRRKALLGFQKAAAKQTVIGSDTGDYISG